MGINYQTSYVKRDLRVPEHLKKYTTCFFSNIGWYRIYTFKAYLPRGYKASEYSNGWENSENNGFWYK